MNEGTISTRIGLRGLPAAAEEIMVARDILIAESVHGRLHLSNLSTGSSLELVRSAKKKGFEVSCDVTPAPFHAHRRGRGVGQLRPQLEDLSAAEIVG